VQGTQVVKHEPCADLPPKPGRWTRPGWRWTRPAS